MHKRLLILMILTALLFCSCLPGDGQASHAMPAGFLWGIWHGWIAPVSLVISLFNPFVRIYEPWNTGFWYDLGFYMAVVGGFGSLTLSRKKKKRRRRDDD